MPDKEGLHEITLPTCLPQGDFMWSGQIKAKPHLFFFIYSDTSPEKSLRKIGIHQYLQKYETESEIEFDNSTIA